MKLRIWLVASVAGLVALGCGATSQGPETGAEGQPRYGGVLNTLIPDDMTDWDMRVNAQNGTNRHAVQLAYNTLIGFKETPHPNISYYDYTVAPELAERWEVSPDAKTFTFHLRKGVKWANLPPLNGREFTSADVKWSTEYLSSTGQFQKLPVSQNSYMYDGMTGIDTPDPYTVIIRFKDGFAPFINHAATRLSPIYPKELLELDGGFTTNVAGTGRYQWDKADSQKGSRWVFTKNPTYFDTDSVYLDKFRFLVIKDGATQQAAFQTRQIDIIIAPDGKSAAEIAKANPNALSHDTLRYSRYLLMHMEKPPLDNMKVRKAISLAIDRDAFVKVMGGRGQWGLVGTALSGADLFTAEEMKQIYRYDVNEAKRLLAEAGYGNGVDVKFLYTAGAPTDELLVPLIQAQLKPIGINIVMDGRTGPEVSGERKKGEFQMHMFTEFPGLDPDTTLFGRYTPNQRLNYTAVNDPKLTQLINAQRREADPVKRRDLVRQAVRYLNENAVGIGIDREVNTRYWHPYVKNYAPHMDLDAWSLGVWLDK